MIPPRVNFSSILAGHISSLHQTLLHDDHWISLCAARRVCRSTTLLGRVRDSSQTRQAIVRLVENSEFAKRVHPRLIEELHL